MAHRSSAIRSATAALLDGHTVVRDPSCRSLGDPVRAGMSTGARSATTIVELAVVASILVLILTALQQISVTGQSATMHGMSYVDEMSKQIRLSEQLRRVLRSALRIVESQGPGAAISYQVIQVAQVKEPSMEMVLETSTLLLTPRPPQGLVARFERPGQRPIQYDFADLELVLEQVPEGVLVKMTSQRASTSFVVSSPNLIELRLRTPAGPRPPVDAAGASAPASGGGSTGASQTPGATGLSPGSGTKGTGNVTSTVTPQSAQTAPVSPTSLSAPVSPTSQSVPAGSTSLSNPAATPGPVSGVTPGSVVSPTGLAGATSPSTQSQSGAAQPSGLSGQAPSVPSSGSNSGSTQASGTPATGSPTATAIPIPVEPAVGWNGALRPGLPGATDPAARIPGATSASAVPAPARPPLPGSLPGEELSPEERIRRIKDRVIARGDHLEPPAAESALDDPFGAR